MVTGNGANAQRRTKSACLNASLCENHFSGQSCRRFQSFGIPNAQPILIASLEDDVMIALAFDSPELCAGNRKI
jgi:hypothetical protein